MEDRKQETKDSALFEGWRGRLRLPKKENELRYIEWAKVIKSYWSRKNWDFEEIGPCFLGKKRMRIAKRPFNFSRKQSVTYKMMVLLDLEICTGMPSLKWKSYFPWSLIYVYFISTTYVLWVFLEHCCLIW